MLKTDIDDTDIKMLADACNELCVAVETYKLNARLNQVGFSWEHLLQRKKEAWDVLAKFGY